MLTRDEAVSMTVIAICGMGCKPVSPDKRDQVTELLDALWENGFANGLQKGQAGIAPA